MFPMDQNLDDLNGILNELSNVFGVRQPSNPELTATSIFTTFPHFNTQSRGHNLNKNMSNSMDDLLVPPQADDEFLYFQPSYVNVESELSTFTSSFKETGTFPPLHELPPPPPVLKDENIEAQFAATESLYLTMSLGDGVHNTFSTSDIQPKVVKKFEPPKELLKTFSEFTNLFPPLDSGYDYEEVEKEDYVEPDFKSRKTRFTPQSSLLEHKSRSSFDTEMGKRSRSSSLTQNWPRQCSENVTSLQFSKSQKTSSILSSSTSSFISSGKTARMAIELPIPPHPSFQSNESNLPVNRVGRISHRVGSKLAETNENKNCPNFIQSEECLSSNNQGGYSTIKRESIRTAEDKALFLRQESLRISEASNSKKTILNVFNTDESYKTIVVDYNAPARDVIEQLLLKNNFAHSTAWQLYEVLTDENLEREIEDHEIVAQIYEKWGTQTSNRLKFQQNFKKYEIFQDPTLYLPGYIDRREGAKDKLSTVEHAKGRLMQEMLMTTDRMTELSGHLYIKERKKKWRRVFCSLRKSGLYFSTKGALKNPRNWNHLVNFTDVNFYLCKDELKRRKDYQAPLSEMIVFVRNSPTQEPIRERVCICCFDRSNRVCWQQGIRLSKYGVEEIRRNYQIAMSRHQKLKQLYADNENDMQTRSKERKKSQTPEFTGQENWFREDLSSKAAEELLMASPSHSGTFLVRSFDGKIYLSVIKENKIYHVEIQRVTVNRNSLLTLNNGLTNFHTLKELVDHYRKEQDGWSIKLNESIKL